MKILISKSILELLEKFFSTSKLMDFIQKEFNISP